jgi:hypothetical protein
MKNWHGGLAAVALAVETAVKSVARRIGAAIIPGVARAALQLSAFVARSTY